MIDQTPKLRKYRSYNQSDLCDSVRIFFSFILTIKFELVQCDTGGAPIAKLNVHFSFVCVTVSECDICDGRKQNSFVRNRHLRFFPVRETPVF